MATRIDVIGVPDWVSSKFQMTSEGFLVGRAPCTNIGVFSYMHPDGTIVKELRLPDEVFNADSMESLKMKPITMDHPNMAVTADTIKNVQVGMTGTVPVNGDNIYLAIDMIITDTDTIKEIKAGKNFLSCGYSCDVESVTGRWLGMEYDAIQKNIRYNHVSIVDAPRAGETAKIRIDHMDAVDAIQVETTEEVTMPDKAVETVKSDEIKSAVKEAVVEIKTDELTAKIDEMQKSYDALVVQKTELEAERDTLKDKADGLQKQVDEFKNAKIDEAVIKSAVSQRLKIIDIARNAEVEVKEDMSDADIKKNVIMKIFPKANLDGRDQVYIDARFDGAVETMESRNDAAMREANADTVPVEADDKLDSKKARDRYVESLTRRVTK
jgi:hypothetical protein